MSFVRRVFYTLGMWIRETGQAMDRAGCRLQGNNAFTEQCEYLQHFLVNIERKGEGCNSGMTGIFFSDFEGWVADVLL